MHEDTPPFFLFSFFHVLRMMGSPTRQAELTSPHQDDYATQHI